MCLAAEQMNMIEHDEKATYGTGLGLSLDIFLFTIVWSLLFVFILCYTDL